MFPPRYFTPNYFTQRYFGAVGPSASVKFTLRAIPQVSWNKLKAEPAVKFKVQTLNDD